MNIKVSQGLEILRPKIDKAFPIPCNEWYVLKNKIQDLSLEPWLFQSAGLLLIGAGLAELISILTGAVKNTPDQSNVVLIAWTVVVVCMLIGAACLFFANKERHLHKSKANDVITHMNLIEERYEKD
jgi:hypothetical protein